MNGQPQLPLIAFFDVVFQPLVLRDVAVGYVDQFRSGIRWLATILGREPKMADLNAETLRRFVQRLAGVGLTEVRCKAVRKVLWRLWRYAHQLGYAERAPVVSRRPRVPKYCNHGPSGLAYVMLDGHTRTYLGKYGSAESRAKYLELVGPARYERHDYGRERDSEFP